jgi:hypothetical protein
MDQYEIAISGVKIASKICDIPIPQIFFYKESDLANKEITGVFLFDDYSIVFNEDWILRTEWLEVMVTCFHETRHAYQYHSVTTKSNEDVETRNQWRREFENYRLPSGKNTPEDDINYLSQSIEIDAIAFAHKMMLQYFEVKTVIPEVIKNKVENNIII